MDIFVYEPIDLKRPAFRLLQLRRGKGPAIECMLYQAYLDGTDTMPYDSLSYTWGGTDKTSTVTVNGKTLYVTENLYSALQHLRSEDIDTVLWVDAICIDQGNERERGHQIQHMCEIYSQAEEVIVWLGQATEETNIVMDSLRRLEEYSSMHGHRHWDLAQWTTFWLLVPQDPGIEPREGLDLLLRRPWFRRVWVLQEIATAKKASVWCGTKSVRARTFALAPSLIGIKPERYCQAVLDIMPGRLREESWWSESRDLYNLLLKFRESRASDPRDKVYALLGISSDARNTDSLRPDYTKDLQKVIDDTSSFLFGPSDVSYETMSKLLENLTSRNVASFLKLAETSDMSEVDRFLNRRGLEVPLSEDMIKAAAGNEKNGRDIMRLFFKKRGREVKVTDGVMEAAVRSVTSGRDIISLLLQKHGSEVSVTKEVINLLQEVFSGGYEEMLRILLREVAAVDARDREFGKLLCMMSEGGHEAAAKLLLDRGVDPNAQSGYYENGLQTALSGAHEAVVKLLLDEGADFNTKGGIHGTALYEASAAGYEAVVKLLLDKGADVNAEGEIYSTALRAASAGGHEAVVKLLLDKGVAVNAEGEFRGTALYAASARGYKEIVKLLLDRQRTPGGFSWRPRGGGEAAARQGRQRQRGGWISRHRTLRGFS
jgi:ankyrin repeat protein